MTVGFIIFALSVITLGSIVIGLFTYARDRENISSVFFALFSVFIGLWGGFSVVRHFAHVSGLFGGSSLLFTQLATASVATALFALLFFSFSFPSGKITLRIGARIFFAVWYVSVMISIFIPGLMVVSETFNEGAIGMQAFQPNTEWGPFYAFYFAPFLFVYFLVSAWQLVKRYRKEADSAQKAQLLYALLGLGIAVGTGLLFWFVIPFIIPQFAGYFWIGRFSVIFFVGITAFAILNERFFSFRVATAEVFTAIILILLTARAISSIGIWREFMINAGLFVLVAFFSRLLINAVKREADHRRKLEAMMNRLSSANERLEELDAIKSQFLSFASHQVKTPMSVIKGYVSLLEDDMDTLSEEEIEDMSGKIRMATDRTIGLVNNLLDLRKIEEERMEYHMDIVDIVSVAEDVFKDMQVMAKSKDLTFTADLPKEAIFVHADLQKVKQVLQNLVENALKYTKEGKVAISVRKDGDRSVIFSVKDTGVGIAKDALPHLFTEFRKSSAVVKAIKGTGLGLYIAKHIIGAHKGEVWAESAGEGKGSTFLVRLVTVPAVDA